MVMATTVIEQVAPFASMKAHELLTDTDNHGFITKHSHGGQHSAKLLIGNAMRERVENIDHNFCDAGEEDTFFVADLGEVYRQHIRWKLNLPRVKPHYAVKCNPDPKLMQLLSKLGTGFDCASKAEVEQVLQMGVDPSRIIYAQPCKTNSYVRYVAAQGVRQMTFDNADELRKIAHLRLEAELFLRILTDDSSSMCPLSLKFGASMDSVDGLLALARELGLKVVGVSFHVGSGALDPNALLKAVREAHTIFHMAAVHGFSMKTLDVGGGFFSDHTFETMAGVLRKALDDYFPALSGINIIAEPGRYYASTVFTLACNIIARRAVMDAAGTVDSATYMLYINDGLYGNFSNIIFDHQHPEAKILRTSGRFLYDTAAAQAAGARGIEYSIWGPTCDGIDRITESIRFDATLNIGDWLYFEEMGAYTKSATTNFNGFSNEHDVLYVCSEPGAKALLDM